jgi:hypothetical protein
VAIDGMEKNESQIKVLTSLSQYVIYHIHNLGCSCQRLISIMGP